MEHLKCPRCGNSDPGEIRVVSLTITKEKEDFLLCSNCCNLYKVKESR